MAMELDERDFRMVARRREEAKQQAIIDATAARNQEILEGADPDPNVGTGFYGQSEAITADRTEEQVKPIVRLPVAAHGVSAVPQPKADNPVAAKASAKAPRARSRAKAKASAKAEAADAQSQSRSIPEQS